MITDELMKQAIDRLARTADGEVLYLYLQSIVMAVPPLDCPEGTLRTDLGRRRFAADLMAIMAQGIDESGGRSDSTSSDGKRTERLVVFARGSAGANPGKHVNFRDYARASDPELRSLTGGDGASR